MQPLTFGGDYPVSCLLSVLLPFKCAIRRVRGRMTGYVNIAEQRTAMLIVRNGPVVAEPRYKESRRISAHGAGSGHHKLGFFQFRLPSLKSMASLLQCGTPEFFNRLAEWRGQVWSPEGRPERLGHTTDLA